MTVICKNHQPIAVAKTLKEAQNIVAEKFGYKNITWEHLCRLTNCKQIYNFKKV